MSRSENVKILIVDDDPVIILELQTAVAKLGKVYIATSGESAIAMANDIVPDLILLDIGLPDINGFDVLRYLNENKLQSVNVIVITAYGNFENHLKSLSQGATDFITKPINKILLQKKIKSIIRNRQILLNKNTPNDTSLNTLDGRFRNLLGIMNEAVVISDEHGKIQMVNDFCNRLFGYENGELLGQNITIFSPTKDQHHPNYLEQYQQTGESALSGSPQYLDAVTKQGNQVQIELNMTDYSDGEKHYYLSLIRDPSEKKITQARLLKAALYDSLTGVYSREALKLDSEKTVRHFDGEMIFACLIDIDRFREINAVFGLRHSDEVLIKLGRKLGEAFSKLPLRIYRVGGDTFVVKSLKPINEAEEKSYKRDIYTIFNHLQYVLRQDLNHRISLSAVARAVNVDLLKTGALVTMLENDLKNSKTAGFLGELYYIEHSDYDRSLQLAELSQSLLNNVDDFKLNVVFQPKISDPAHVTSAEALLRWDNTSYNLLNLTDFICVAENTGKIIEVGYFVLKKVCELMQEVAELGRPMEISINFSLRQLADTQLVNTFVDICDSHRVDTKLITFEVTETVMAENIELLTKVLYQLKEKGFCLSIDDFGTGHSNLRYLNRLPIDELKIDKSFIDDIQDIEGSYPIVDTVINMAKIMKLKLVAEGVETKNQVDYLRNKNCDFIQGFYFYKPLIKDDWIALFKSSEKSTYP